MSQLIEATKAYTQALQELREIRHQVRARVALSSSNDQRSWGDMEHELDRALALMARQVEFDSSLASKAAAEVRVLSSRVADFARQLPAADPPRPSSSSS